MKDPHEHTEMLHENEDVRKRDCRKYKELYGKHFTKDLCEWAVSKMENRNGTHHHYTLEEVKNKYGKLVEYKIIKSNSKRNRVEMVFTRKDGTYSGTDIIRYPFRIIHHELGIQCRFYDLRGSFATKTLRKGCEIKDISKVLGHSRVETTKNYYISSTEKSKRLATDVFDKITKSEIIEEIIKYK